jgi:hypothetical protein
VAFEIYGAAANATDRNPDVIVAMTFWQDNRKANETPVYVISRFSNPERRLLRCRYQLPLAGFRRGTYILQVNVIDQAGSRHAHARLPLVIL